MGHSAEDLLEKCFEGWKKHTGASLIALSTPVCMWENPSLCPPAPLRAVIPPHLIIIHTLLAPVLLLCSLTPLPALNHAVIINIPREEGSRCSSFFSIPCRAAGEDGKAVAGSTSSSWLGGCILLFPAGSWRINSREAGGLLANVIWV